MFPKIVVPPKSSILIGFSIINHPFWGYPYCWKQPDMKPSTRVMPGRFLGSFEILSARRPGRNEEARSPDFLSQRRFPVKGKRFVWVPGYRFLHIHVYNMYTYIHKKYLKQTKSGNPLQRFWIAIHHPISSWKWWHVAMHHNQYWISGWWFQPIWKILVKLDHFPR